MADQTATNAAASTANTVSNASVKQWLLAAAGVVLTLVAIYYFVEIVSRAWKRGQETA